MLFLLIGNGSRTDSANNDTVLFLENGEGLRNPSVAGVKSARELRAQSRTGSAE
jgi:hypothetical protein